MNGSPTTASVLAQLGALLVDLHGQHETQSLLHADAQRDILDAFAHAEAERAAVAEAHAALHGAPGRGGGAGGAARRGAPPGRLPAPRGQRDRRREAQAGRGRGAPGRGPAAEPGRGAGRAARSGSPTRWTGEGGNALGAVTVADRALASLEKIGSRRSPAGGRCSTPPTPTSPSWRGSPRSTPRRSQEDPARLAEVERRRDLLFRLTQKYGATVEAVLADPRRVGRGAGPARHGGRRSPGARRAPRCGGGRPRAPRRSALTRAPPRGVGSAGARGQPAAAAARAAGRQARASS